MKSNMSDLLVNRWVSISFILFLVSNRVIIIQYFFNILTVTRAKKRIYHSFGIKESFIGLIRNYKYDALAYLQSTDPNGSIENGSKKTLKRRASVAGGGLFSVQNRVQETGFDYLPRANKPSGSISNNANNVLNIPNASNGVAITPTTYNKKHDDNSEKSQNELNGEASTSKSNNGNKDLQPPNATTIAMTSITSNVENLENSQDSAIGDIGEPVGSISCNANNVLKIPNTSNGVAIAITSTTYNKKHGETSENSQNNQNELNGEAGEASASKSNNGNEGLQPPNATTIAMTSIASNEEDQENDENDEIDKEIDNFVQNVKNTSIGSLAPIHNNFNPFRRLPNVPFSKRPRANSLFDSRRPSLDTVTEEDMNIPDESNNDISAKEAENIRKWMNKSFQ